MKKENLVLGFFVGLIILNILAWNAVFNSFQAFLLKMVFFDVGQGDSIFIETPQKHQILIDGGPDSKILEKLAQQMPFYDKSIDLIILTHPEKDHLVGLIDILKHYQVNYVLWTGIVRDSQEYQEWIKIIKDEQNQGAQIKIGKSGQKIFAGDAEIFILYPFENLQGQKFEDSNNTSIVAKLNFGNNSFLFTGDIYDSAEKDLIREYSCSNSPVPYQNEVSGLGCIFVSNVIKVAHHGSKTSTNQEFVEKVLPQIAVIQCGKDNPYGHPHQQTLETLNNYDVKILRTDELGDIKIISDGYSLRITN